MKNGVFLFCFVLILSSCNEDSIHDSKQPSQDGEEQTNISAKNNSSARRPDGSGSGAPGAPGDSGSSSGFALTWNGDGRWHGNFAGSPVWFWGPTPTQLQNGIRGTWEVTCAYYTPGVCYPDNFTVWGNGESFTVGAPACSGLGSTTITMPKITATFSTNSNGGKMQPIIINRIWGTDTRTITTLSGGNCSLFAEGKVIVNERCIPMIVSPASTSVVLCGYQETRVD